MKQETIAIALVQVECLIPMAQSLKQKRSVVKSSIERLRKRFNASVVESGYQDKWQRCLISCCAISTDRAQLQSLPDKMQAILNENHELQVCEMRLTWL